MRALSTGDDPVGGGGGGHRGGGARSRSRSTSSCSRRSSSAWRSPRRASPSSNRARSAASTSPPVLDDAMPSLTARAASRLASSRSRLASRASRSANTTLACSWSADCSRWRRSSASCSEAIRCSIARRSPLADSSRAGCSGCASASLMCQTSWDESVWMEPTAGASRSGGLNLPRTRDIGGRGARLERRLPTLRRGMGPAARNTDTRTGNSDRCRIAREVSARRAPPASEPAFSVLRWALCSRRPPVFPSTTAPPRGGAFGAAVSQGRVKIGSCGGFRARPRNPRSTRRAQPHPSAYR